MKRILFYLCLSFILGIILGFFNVSFSVLLIFSFGLFWSLSRLLQVPIKSSLFILIAFLMLFSVVGGWTRYNSVAAPEITPANLSYVNDEPQRIEIIGVVKRVEQRAKNNRLIVQAEKIEIEKEKRIIDGKVMVFIPRLVEVNYGDRIKVKGQLETPQPINGFNWPKYLANENIRSVMFRPWVTMIEKNQGAFIMNKIYFLNSFLQKRIDSFLPYPESAILSAMLLGNKGEIPEVISHNFRQTGLGHILAISGLHITVISAIFFWVALSLGLWRKQAFALTSLLLFFYILMIGASPSAIRAGIMSFLFLLAQYFGRKYSFSNAIVFAATLILVFNPLSLFYDISFQLSFAAVLAILLLFPLFQRYVYEKLKRKKQNFLLNTFLMSGAILLFIGPLMVYYFGNFPIISPIVNLLAIPVLPFILFFGIVFLLVSLIFPPLSFVFSGLVYLLISFLIHLGNFFANLPMADFFQIENVPVYSLVIYYIVLLFVIYKIKKRTPSFLLLKI